MFLHCQIIPSLHVDALGSVHMRMTSRQRVKYARRHGGLQDSKPQRRPYTTLSAWVRCTSALP